MVDYIYSFINYLTYYPNWLQRSIVSAVILGAFYLVKSRLIRAILLVLSFVWLKYIDIFLRYLSNIATDSLAETISPNYTELVVYVKELFKFIIINPRRTMLALEFFAVASLYAIIVSYALKYIISITSGSKDDKSRRFILCIIVYICVIGLISFVPQAWGLAHLRKQANEEVAGIKNNFTSEKILADKIIPHQTPIKLVVYIGESTSSQNMGVYGYYRDTTPNISNLNKNNSLMLGQNYLATHTHTSQSLLEALSVPYDKKNNEDKIKTIFQKKRTSIVDILKASGIKTELVSNQGKTGTYNYVSFFIFGSVDKEKYGGKCHKLLGNLAKYCDLPLDGDLLLTQLEKYLSKKEEQSSVIFLHSYAGHFPYYENNVPNFSNIYKELFSNLEDDALSKYISRKSVNDYDSVIKYIDSNIARAINLIKKLDTPAVLLYFSDHGDDIYQSSRHDSSRFVHSMIRIPLILFINNAAQSILGENKYKLKKYLSSKEIKTLRDVPIIMKAVLSSKTIAMPKGKLEPILVRKLKNGFSAISIEDSDFTQNKQYKDVTDYETKNFVLAQTRDNPVCLHSSNTIQKVLTGSLSSGCIEIDIEIDNNKIWVNHPPSPRNGLTITEVAEAASNYNSHLWLDAKNLKTQNQCSTLIRKIVPIRNVFNRVLLEFPPTANMNTLHKCIDSLKNHAIESSYHIPSEELVLCAESAKNKQACQIIKQKIDAALSNGVGGLSFNYSGKNALQRINLSENVKLHAREISHAEALSPNSNYDLIIPLDDTPRE